MTKPPIFQRSLAAITLEDLDELKATEEGWYVEFKQQWTSNEKIAKSLCSFANSYGGLLVIGAKEDQKTRRLECFTGFDETTASQIVTQVREAIVNHSSPSPFFESKHIKYDAEKWIVLVRIPQGSHPPYVHSSGAIYRRVGDQAAPRAESNAAVIEQYISESKSKKLVLTKKILRQCTDDKSKQPRCDIVIKLIGDLEVNSRASLAFEEFQKLAATPLNEKSSSLYTNFHPHDDSFVARRIEKDIFQRSLLWDYDSRRSLHIAHIPLAAHMWNGENFEETSTPSAAHFLDSVSYFRKYVPQKAILIDLLSLLFFVSDILYKVKTLHRLEGYKGKVIFNAKLSNVNACIPFLSTSEYKKQIENFGIPVALRNLDFIRDLDNYSDWIDVSDKKNIEDQQYLTELKLDLIQGTAVFAVITQSIGVTFKSSVGGSNTKDGLDIAELADVFSKYISGPFSFSNVENPLA